MRIYWIDYETIYATVKAGTGETSDRNCKTFEDYECLPDSEEYLKKARAYCEKLAKQYAKRHNLKAFYTIHPRLPRACWKVH